MAKKRLAKRTMDFYYALGLPTRLFNALKYEGITNVDDFMKLRDREILQMRRVGKKGLVLIKAAQERLKAECRAQSDLMQVH